MIDFGGRRKIPAQLIQLGIGRRNQIRIETGMLNFAFPLVAKKIVSRNEWQRDQTQNDRKRPKQDRLLSQCDVDLVRHRETVLCRKVGNRREIRYSAKKCRSDKIHRHSLKRPVIEEI